MALNDVSRNEPSESNRKTGTTKRRRETCVVCDKSYTTDGASGVVIGLGKTSGRGIFQERERKIERGIFSLCFS